MSLYIAIPAFLLASFFGVMAGVVAGLRRGKIVDTVVTSLANLGIAIPHFWLAMLMIYFFGIYLNWLPVQGYTSPFEDFWLSIKKIIMPVFVITIWGLTFYARQARSVESTIISRILFC